MVRPGYARVVETGRSEETGTLTPPSALAASVEAATCVGPEVAARIAELGTELLQHADAVADAVNRRAIETEPALVDADDPSTAEATLHSSQANVGAILAQLAYGVPGKATLPSAGALELFERLADHEDGLTTVLRGYRVGIAELWQIWAAHVAQRVEDPQELHAVMAASTAHMLMAVDRISQELVDSWAETRRRRRQGLDVSPEELVRAALFDGAGADEALGRLGYPQDALHVAVALPPSLDEASVRQLVSRLRVVGDAETVSARWDTGWVVWLAFERDPLPRVKEALEEALTLPDPVGTGSPAPGLEGFRSSYREALDARRIAVLRGSSGVTRHRDVALLAVLCADPERARALAVGELGPLAQAGDDTMERLRETLTAYLACGESHVGAAQRLFVHQKTVAYRIRQAEALLGRRIGDRRVELEAALLVHRALLPSGAG